MTKKKSTFRYWEFSMFVERIFQTCLLYNFYVPMETVVSMEFIWKINVYIIIFFYYLHVSIKMIFNIGLICLNIVWYFFNILLYYIILHNVIYWILLSRKSRRSTTKSTYIPLKNKYFHLVLWRAIYIFWGPFIWFDVFLRCKYRSFQSP